MTWSKVSLTGFQVTNGEYDKLQRKFMTQFIKLGGPKGAALFSGSLRKNNLALYFSPEASRLMENLIEEYSGYPCEKPDESKIGLLVGDIG